MMMEKIFLDSGDDDPLGPAVDLLAAMPPAPAKGYVAVPLAWLAKVLPVVRSPHRLAAAMLLYRRCRLCHSQTVDLSNGDFAAVSLTRYTKYRMLIELERAGALTAEVRNGRSVRVTLHWFP
jgi:hypothetical protein